jgi:hypothetical protein
VETELTLNFDEDRVDEKSIAVASMRTPQSALVSGTEFVAPQPKRFPADLDSSMSQQIFNIVVTEAESVIQPYRVSDDNGRESVAFIRVGTSFHRSIVAQPHLTCRRKHRNSVLVQKAGGLRSEIIGNPEISKMKAG